MAQPSQADIQAMYDALFLESQYPTLGSIDPDWQDAQKDYFSTNKAGATLAADPSFLLINQALDPGTFDPLTSYEPVETPGRTKLNQWSTGNDFQRLVSGMLLSGTASTGSIISELARMVAKPENDTEKNIVALLPPAFRFDEITGEQTQQGIDFQGVRDEIQSLESAMNSDPQGAVIDPSTGLPAMITTEDSPMTKKLRSLGYVNTPGDPYTGYDLAPEGVTPESDLALGQTAVASRIPYAVGQGVEGSSQNKYEALLKQSDEAQRKYQERLAMTRAAMGDRVPGGTAAALPGTQPIAARGDMPANRSPLLQAEEGELNPGAPPNFTVNPSTGAIIYGPGQEPRETAARVGGILPSLGGPGANTPFPTNNELSVNPSTGVRTGTQSVRPPSGGFPTDGGEDLGPAWDQWGNALPIGVGGPGASRGLEPGAAAGATAGAMLGKGSPPPADTGTRGWSFGKGSPPPEDTGSRGWSFGKANPINPPVGQRQQGADFLGNAFAQAVARNALAQQAEEARMGLARDQRGTNLARKRMVSAVIANDRAKEAARQRQAAANQLTAQGRTKFGDEVQRRMAIIYGQGM